MANIHSHYFITVSDASGSRYYRVRRSLKTTLRVGVSVLVLLLLALSAFNYVQYQLNRQLQQKQAELGAQFEHGVQTYRQLQQTYRQLQEAIAEQRRVVSEITQSMAEIERISGVDTGDKNRSLAQRIDLLGELYRDKDHVYVAIDERVRYLEEMIAADRHPATAQNTWDDLLHRIDLVNLNVIQEKILRDNIPSGYPIETSTITSPFGDRIHPITKLESFHNGIDLRAKQPQPVYTTADGIVRQAEFLKFSGNQIIVQHNLGFETRYAHLHEIQVKPGDVLRKGDQIGLSGNTGRSVAPHLHYEIRHLDSALDPIDFLKWEFGSNTLFTQVGGIQWASLVSLISKQTTHRTLQLSQLEADSPESLK